MIKAENILTTIFCNINRFIDDSKYMKSFQVSLTKSYLVSLNVENEEDAKRFAGFFTGDIFDISNDSDREERHFSIEKIESVINEASQAEST